MFTYCKIPNEPFCLFADDISRSCPRKVGQPRFVKNCVHTAYSWPHGFGFNENKKYAKEVWDNGSI